MAYTTGRRHKAPVGNRTRNSIAEATKALKERYRREQADKAAYLQERTTVQAMTTNALVPNKGVTKGAGPMSKGTSQAYGANTMRTCPGGARDEARTGAYAAFLKQVDHPETGCIVVEANSSTAKRLTRSAQNANTTHGNYSPTITH